MIFAALDEAAQKGELLLVTDGMCRFHMRRDFVLVIREMIVLPFRRRQGIGRRMVGYLRFRYPSCVLRARCPASYESNGFWERMGFKLAATEKGVNVWELHPDSSSVPTETLPTPPSLSRPAGSTGRVSLPVV